jgi:hypothetical protein
MLMSLAVVLQYAVVLIPLAALPVQEQVVLAQTAPVV